MKAIAVLLALCAMLFVSVAEARGVRVRGYTRKDGTYVAPHYRSAPNSNRSDNYSTRGNYNPYTGKLGTVDPYAPGSLPRQTSYGSSSYVAPATAPPASPPTSPSNWRNYGNQQSTTLNPSGIPIGEQRAASMRSENTAERESALIAVQELGQRLRAADPQFDRKFALIQGQVREIQNTLPPAQWVGAISAAWHGLPAFFPSQAFGPASSQQTYEASQCQAAQDKARELADAANNLAKCASWGDLRDDCARQARAVRYAADDYQDAVNSTSGICQ